MNIIDLKIDSTSTKDKILKPKIKNDILERKYPKKKININLWNYYINIINYFCFSHNIFLWI